MTRLTIYVTNSGQETRDFAEMLGRMYIEWGNRHGWSLWGRWIGDAIDFELDDEQAQLLRGEVGFHRLCRISPNDDQKRRHTCFCAVHLGTRAPLGEGPIRSYILDPYIRCVNHFTGEETEDVHGVLAGNLSLIGGSANDDQSGTVELKEEP